jgi:hypothetical protein
MSVPSDPPPTRERHVTALPTETIGSHEKSWAEARQDNVIAVVHAINDETPAVEIGTPYYWHHEDWIARVWDVTLYLRQTGLVKFGRWASHELFRAAWVAALRAIAPDHNKDQLLTADALQHGLVQCSRTIPTGQATAAGWQLYYDNGSMVQGSTDQWISAPSDGVLCATYFVPYSGIEMRFAMRRYTFYFWRGHELLNTDKLEEVLIHFPQCKIGVPSFQGSSYRHMGLAIAAAYADDLKDVRK